MFGKRGASEEMTRAAPSRGAARIRVPAQKARDCQGGRIKAGDSGSDNTCDATRYHTGRGQSRDLGAHGVDPVRDRRRQSLRRLLPG